MSQWMFVEKTWGMKGDDKGFECEHIHRIPTAGNTNHIWMYLILAILSKCWHSGSSSALGWSNNKHFMKAEWGNT